MKVKAILLSLIFICIQAETSPEDAEFLAALEERISKMTPEQKSWFESEIGGLDQDKEDLKTLFQDFLEVDACQFWHEGAFYSLYEVEDAPLFYQASTVGQNFTTTAVFTFCKKLQTLPEESGVPCRGGFYAEKYVNETCSPLSTVFANSIQKDTHVYEEDGEEVEGLALRFTNNNGAYLKVDLVCDSYAEESTVSPLVILPDGLGFETKITASFVCPIISLSWIEQIVVENHVIFGAIMIGIGVFLNILGRKVFVLSLFLAGLITSVYICMTVYFSYFHTQDTEEEVTMVVFALTLLFGTIIGYLVAKLARIGGFFLGAWAGFTATLVLEEIILYKTPNKGVFWAVALNLTMIGGLLGFALFNQAVIISTAFIGAYMIARGITIILGGFLFEEELLSEMEQFELDLEEFEIEELMEQDVNFVWYLGGLALLTLFGIIVQFYIYRKENMASKKAAAK